MITQHGENQVVVLHLVGAGRSGSTLLNIILANHPRVFGAGELAFLVRGWSEGHFCSCGQRLEVCPFWGEVQKLWIEKAGITCRAEYLMLQQKFERYRRLPRLLKEVGTPSEEFSRYGFWTELLFGTIQEVSGRSLIVDSSKNPVRVLALSGFANIDLRVLFLVRDVRGYAWSRRKAFEQNKRAGLGWAGSSSSAWRSAVEWDFFNLISEWISSRVHKSAFVRYEDLITNSAQVISTIGQLMGTDLSSLSAILADGQPLQVEHVAAGNRLRMQKEITLRNGGSWKSQMSSNEQNVAWLLGSWLMRKYGYTKSEA